MFDIGFDELLLLAVVALVVLGPEKLPHAARMAGAWLGRIRRTVIGIQAEIEKEVAAQEMRERIEKEVARLRASEVALQQEAQALGQTVENSIRPPEPLPANPITDTPTLPSATDASASVPPPAPSSPQTPS